MNGDPLNELRDWLAAKINYKIDVILDLSPPLKDEAHHYSPSLCRSIS